MLLSAVVPILPPYLKNRGVHDGLIGLLFASKAIVQLLFGPIVGHQIPKQGVVQVLLFGMFIMSSTSIFFGFGRSYATLLAARSIQGNTTTSSTNHKSKQFMLSFYVFYVDVVLGVQGSRVYRVT
jgi:MFS family permease